MLRERSKEPLRRLMISLNSLVQQNVELPAALPLLKVMKTIDLPILPILVIQGLCCVKMGWQKESQLIIKSAIRVNRKELERKGV